MNESMTTDDALLEVDDLSVQFHLSRGSVDAVNHLSFKVRQGSAFGIVGESGSGKSVTALTVMGLLASPPGRVESGRILYRGEDLLRKTRDEMREYRGRNISMVYQDPMTALNPVLRIGFQIAETLMVHEGLPRAEAEQKAVDLMRATGIPEPEKRARGYPHQFSGGMRQRVVIAMALANNPDLLIADEPTTALDVITQAQILALLKSLQKERNMTVVLITHDLGIVAEFCDEVLVMYAGHGMEIGTTRDIFLDPQHPYTKGLLNSITRVEKNVGRLQSIPGEIPDLIHPPVGCRFNPRCPYVFEKCRVQEPPAFPTPTGGMSKCWLLETPR
jgi:oligopeptide/dipeptide ABC transporter ATP-binding protein